ncbi:glycoside hydrolase superfamily [Mycena leptocephala]|nr:glycoside hydrolase superfamily [Mycena leptocephala]
MGSAASRGCLPWDTDAIDTTTFTHIIYAYASLDSNGTVSLTDAQADQVKAIVKLKDSSPDLKVFIAVGGWGIGADASSLIDLATSNSSQTNFGTTALSLLTSLGADGIDIEWAPCMNTSCISADDFSTIASTVKSELGSKLLSLSTPTAFWSLSGLNTTTTNLAKIVEFVSLITLEPSTTDV